MTAVHTALIWRDPPPKVQGRITHPWAAWATQLRSRPGQWALLVEFPGRSSAHTVARRHRAGAYPRFPATEFELRAVKLADRSELYGRCVGGPRG